MRENIVLETKFDRDVTVFIDLVAFNRSIDNIIRNSVDAISDKGVITIETQFSDQSKGGHVSIIFCDTGPGFSQKALKAAGDPFFTTKRDLGGSGLGLSSAAGFLQQSGGQFEWGNTQHGAYVQMTLPANQGVYLGPDNDDTLFDLDGLTMLLVEDDPNILKALERQLTHAGASVSIASSFEEALEVADRLEDGVDLLLSDIHLSDIGPDGTDLLKQTEGFYRMGILMTGYSELVGQLSTYHTLPKPFALDDLRKMLGKIASDT